MGCTAGSLLEALVPVADSARQLAADLGLRPLRVYLVWVGWTLDAEAASPVIRDGMEPDHALEVFSRLDLSADVVGVGTPIVLYEHEISPPPRVRSATNRDADSVGVTERGTIRVDQISARYPEDVFSGLVAPFRAADGERLVPGVEFFWEIRDARARGFVVPGSEADRLARNELAPARRRYHLVGLEGRDPGLVQWAVTLRRADGERRRDGSF